MQTIRNSSSPTISGGNCRRRPRGRFGTTGTTETHFLLVGTMLIRKMRFENASKVSSPRKASNSTAESKHLVGASTSAEGTLHCPVSAHGRCQSVRGMDRIKSSKTYNAAKHGDNSSRHRNRASIGDEHEESHDLSQRMRTRREERF